MTVFDFQQVPNVITMQLLGNTALYPSPLIASAQTLDRGGLKWKTVASFTNIKLADRADLLGLIAALRGQANRLRIIVHDNPKRGAYGGTPLVVGAGQTGSTLNIDGLSLSVTNWIRKGDYFSVVVNGDHELKMSTTDENSSGTGTLTLKFEPRLRASPLDNAVIFVEDGVLGVPRGVFVLESSVQGWASRASDGGQLSDVSLSLVEDVFATQ